MKILYCNKYSYRFSGTEAYLFDLMKMMRAQGNETALFAMADRRAETTPYDRFLLDPLDFKQAGMRWPRKIRLAAHAIYSRSARRKLSELIQEFRPDVAHVRNVYHHLSQSIFWELKKHHVPVIYHLNDFKLLCPNYNFVAHGESCERCHGGKYWQAVSTGCYSGGRCAAMVLVAEAYAHRWLQTYRHCVDLFLAPSEFVRDKLVEHGWPASKIEVLPHFQRIHDRATSGDDPGTGILYFGRLSPEKGLRELLEAMMHLPDVRLTLAGEGPQRLELEKFREQLHLNNVEFVGQLHGDALTDAIRRSRFTVFPSRAYETLGKSILESYAWAKPVVASDLGSRREFVRPGETGFLYDSGNSHQLAESLALLHSRPDLAVQMGLAGQELLREKHSPEQHCESVCALYEKLSEASRPSPSSSAPTKRGSLRIAFIGGRGVISKYSGIEAYYEEVGSRLVARGHTVTVYCRSYFTRDVPDHLGMRLVRLPTLRLKSLETLIHTALSTAHAMTQHYDVIHYHALGPALFAFIPRLVGVKTAVTVQGLDGRRKKWGPLAAFVLGCGEWVAVHGTDSTMVVSRALQHYFRGRYFADPVYIANGARLREHAPPAHLREWQLTPGEYVLFLGRLSPEKNCDQLVRAFEDLKGSQHLVLAGGIVRKDPYSQALLRHASDRIRFLDYVSGSELDELLTNAMLFVLPSDLEGLSLALLDAMGAGLCVLTSDIPENRELVRGAGFTFHSGDLEDLKRMLCLLIASPTMRDLAGRKARQRVLQHYAWDHITTQIEQQYLKVTGKLLGPVHRGKKDSNSANGKIQSQVA